MVVHFPVLFLTEVIEERLFLVDCTTVNRCVSLSAFEWATNQLYTMPCWKVMAHVLVIYVVPCLIQFFVDDITIIVLTGVDRHQSLPIDSQLKSSIN